MGKVKIDELVNDGGVPFVSDEIINQNWSKIQAKLNRKDRKLFWWFNGTFGAVVLVALLSSGLAYGIYVKQKSERNDKTENTLSQINKDKKPLRTKRTEDKSEIVKSKIPKNKAEQNIKIVGLAKVDFNALGPKKKTSTSGIGKIEDSFPEETRIERPAYEAQVPNNALVLEADKRDKSQSVEALVEEKKNTESLVSVDGIKEKKDDVLKKPKQNLALDSLNKVKAVPFLKNWKIEAMVLYNPNKNNLAERQARFGGGLNFRYGFSSKVAANLGFQFTHYMYDPITRKGLSSVKGNSSSRTITFEDTISSYWSSFIRIPITIERKLSKSFSVNTGLYMSYRLKDYGNMEVKTTDSGYYSSNFSSVNSALGITTSSSRYDGEVKSGFTNFKKFDLGLIGGAQYRFGKKFGWGIGIQGTIGLIDFSPNSGYSEPKKYHVNKSLEITLSKTIFNVKRK